MKIPEERPSPERFTAVIGSIADAWSNLLWNYEVFRQLQWDGEERAPIGFAALNMCLAAVALSEWTCWQIHPNKGEKGESHREFYKNVNNTIPHQSLCVAIANTYKHRIRNKEIEWKGSSLITYYEGSEDSQPGWQIVHEEKDGGRRLALENFNSLIVAWWNFLYERALVEEQHRTPPWLSERVRKIFGTP